MYTIEELEKQEKSVKKLLRELGGLGEIFPDVKKNYEEQISSRKKLIAALKEYDENKDSRFGKKAKTKKEALQKTEELSGKLDELLKNAEELEKKLAPADAISPERTLELKNMANEFKTEEIKNLEFDELAVAFGGGIEAISKLSNAEQKNEILLEKYNRQQKNLQKPFFDKLRASEEFFVAFSPATHMPYVDLREPLKQSCLWLFTKEEYAHNCRKHFARQYVFIDVVKYSNKEFFEYSKNLPRLGFNAIVINNGVHNLTVETAPVIGKLQYSCPINPMLHARRLDFFQALLVYNKVPQTNHTLYERFHNPMIMKAKESIMLNELAKATYTMVMKANKVKNEKDEEVVNTEIPTNMKGDTRFLLVFSDMLEFDAWKKSSGFNTNDQGFTAKSMDFAAIDSIANDTQSELLLDRAGWCMELGKERRETIKEVAAKVREAEEKANKQKK